MKNPQILDLYSDFLLSSFGLVTSTGLATLLNNEYSHDKIGRFLAQSTFDNKDFWKSVKPLIRKVESEEAILIIDDTIEEKPHSTENDLICYHFDHCSGQNIKGINIVNFLYCSLISADTHVNLPCAFETIRKTEKYLDTKTNTLKRRSPVSKNTLVLERLRTLVQLNRLKFKYVLWDTWFSSKDNFDFIHHQLNKIFHSCFKK